jgi:hypothetical protein
MQRAQLGVVGHADAADPRQRLREGADHEVHFTEHTLRLGTAESGGAIGAERMCLVHEQVRPVLATHVHDVAQRRHVAANRIQAFDHDEAVAPDAVSLGQALELLAQALGGVMAETDDLRRRLAGRVVDARVAVAVDQDHIVGAAEAADEREVCLVAGAEDEGVSLAEPVGELPLELFVQREGAVGRPGSGRAGAVVLERALAGGNDLGVEREPEIVVGAEHERWPPLDHDLAGTEHAIDHGQAGRRSAVRQPGAALCHGPQLVEKIHQRLAQCPLHAALRVLRP